MAIQLADLSESELESFLDEFMQPCLPGSGADGAVVPAYVPAAWRIDAQRRSRESVNNSQIVSESCVVKAIRAG